MQATLGTQVQVENKPGAGGRIAAQGVKDAAADGNTLMLAPFAVMVLQPAVFRSIKYDTTADFAPVGAVVTFPLALAVGPSTPATTMKELVDWLQANPTQGNYGSPGAGTHAVPCRFTRCAAFAGAYRERAGRHRLGADDRDRPAQRQAVWRR